MAVKDFPPRPDGVEPDSNQHLSWLDAVGDALNIDAHISATPALADEVDIFSVSASGRRKTTLTAIQTLFGGASSSLDILEVQVFS